MRTYPGEGRCTVPGTKHQQDVPDPARILSTQRSEGNVLLDVAGAAAHLGVSEAFVRRLVFERRVRYFKVGKFVRFRPSDLDAFVEAGRRDPVQPWVHIRSTQRRGTAHPSPQRRSTRDQ